MMSKLDELKALVSEQFEKADPTMKSKAYIDQYAHMNSLIDDIAKENKALVDNNAELSKSYKDLVLHSTTPKATSTTVNNNEDNSGTGEVESFEDFLYNYDLSAKSTAH